MVSANQGERWHSGKGRGRYWRETWKEKEPAWWGEPPTDKQANYLAYLEKSMGQEKIKAALEILELPKNLKRLNRKGASDLIRYLLAHKEQALAKSLR
jgi:hypothetical protein